MNKRCNDCQNWDMELGKNDNWGVCRVVDMACARQYGYECTKYIEIPTRQMDQNAMEKLMESLRPRKMMDPRGILWTGVEG
jgi:hypothetical protein